MKLLLTSAGIKNASIHDALVDLLGKPIGESDALCSPTKINGSVYGSRVACAGAWRFITGRSAIVLRPTSARRDLTTELAALGLRRLAVSGAGQDRLTRVLLGDGVVAAKEITLAPTSADGSNEDAGKAEALGDRIHVRGGDLVTRR
jgi:hypothetical protein